ncbi:uncharacterized protein J4E88_008589 [Alternaria novae-zelandiae]|uniref:uncharacterized protein n=1 Tax=Alternaria novae-zelandiae TaxID=430562 RepID=UPI0020C22067|nr:uncharacterized protein J4E88_008589 [Alternaria novae-zelandiae]KAI4673534.1 hypothetical protein J4E88_008589 [Alternaria novae-zelandiae]
MPVSLELRTDTAHPDTLTSSSKSPDLDPEIAAGNSPHFLITINDPQTLSVFGTTLATGDANVPILQPQLSRKSADDHFLLPSTAIKALRIWISPYIYSNDVLELVKHDHENDEIPYLLMESIVESWREAFRCIPERHCIEHVEFDVRYEEVHNIQKVAQLLQAVATAIIYTIKPQLPLSWLKRQENLHAHPFICPVCIEDRIRSQYSRYLEDHQKNRSASQKVMDDVETNVQLWTYEAVLEAVAKGGRVCEAEDKAGIFRIKYLEGFKALGQRRDAMNGVWDMRNGCAQEIGVEEQDRATPDEDAEMDDLVEQLSEAKIAIAQDSAVDDLAEGVSGL